MLPPYIFAILVSKVNSNVILTNFYTKLNFVLFHLCYYYKLCFRYHRTLHHYWSALHPMSEMPRVALASCVFITIRYFFLISSYLFQSLNLDGELWEFVEGNLLTSIRLVDILKWTLIGTGGVLGMVGAVRAMSLRQGKQQSPARMPGDGKEKRTQSAISNNRSNRQSSIFSVNLPSSVPGTPESLGHARGVSPPGPQLSPDLPPITSHIK